MINNKVNKSDENVFKFKIFWDSDFKAYYVGKYIWMKESVNYYINLIGVFKDLTECRDFIKANFENFKKTKQCSATPVEKFTCVHGNKNVEMVELSPIEEWSCD